MAGRIVRAALVALALAVLATPATADEAWTIESFSAEIAIQADGSFLVDERIDTLFPSPMHGIFREVPYRYAWDADHDRVYDVSVLDVADASGRSWRYDESRQGADLVLKIGDPDRTITGRQTYRIRYRVAGALNGFPEQDELYWNVNGLGWDVPTRSVAAVVTLPRDGVLEVTCFQGPAGSTQLCRAASDARRATFAATRALRSRENLTIVVAMAKGVVPDPRPRLERRPREVDAWFDATPVTLGASVFVLLGGLTLVGYNWYLRGRDRAYTTNYYLTDDPAEDVRPLFGGPAIVPEYEPPEKLRPAELGLVLDERADPRDVTATIVDLAARGYLTITELPNEGLFGLKRDWRLARAAHPRTDELSEYERLIFDGLFKTGPEVKLSELRGKFVDTLRKAQRALYSEAVKRKWFPTDPDRTRAAWIAIGVGVTFVGGALVWLLGSNVGAGLVGLAFAVVGPVVAAVSGAMPARTARGSEVLRRTLGFRMYMVTAETHRAQFAEREGIFSAYLPYAIVFGCVDRWAAAFSGLDAAARSVSWYTGSGPFNANAFSSDLRGFSSSLASTVASTPGGRGSSGFSGGGSSGGGGGGGGGGGW